MHQCPKKGRAFFETTTSFFSQKIASQHLPLLSLPSSFRLSSPNLKYNGFLCSAHLLSLFFPFKSWFFPYSLMITWKGSFEIIFHHFTFTSTSTMWEVPLLSASNNQLASHLKLSSPRLLWMRDPFCFWEILLFVNGWYPSIHWFINSVKWSDNKFKIRYLIWR